MKYLIVFLFILGSCKSKNTSSYTENSNNDTLCPQDGNCTYNILKNQKMVYNMSELGEFYPTFSDGENIVFKFEYRRNDKPDIQDYGYREEVFIELNPHDLELKSTTPNSHKIVFARWCFCKGQAGYYKIQQSELSIKKIENTTYQLDITFKMEEVPQIISKISYVFTL